MDETLVDCPNCGGSGRAGTVPLQHGGTLKGKCFICIGSGKVPEWDLLRLTNLVRERSNCVQMSLAILDRTES